MKYEYELRQIDLLDDPISTPIGGNRVIYHPSEHYTAYQNWHKTELTKKLNQLGSEGWEVVTIDNQLLTDAINGTVLLKRAVSE